MTTDNKTLADVQPGGRVRLGDQAERARFEKWMTDVAKIIVGSSDPYPAGLERGYWRVWQAALSAQPSTGGQDALADEIDLIRAVLDGYPESIARADAMRATRIIRAALAARQPVGQEPAGYMTKDRKHVAHPSDATEEYSVPLYAAPPAQDVDLGQFRELASEMDRFRTKWKTVSIAEFNHYADRLLALIDNQAVGK